MSAHGAIPARQSLPVAIGRLLRLRTGHLAVAAAIVLTGAGGLLLAFGESERAGERAAGVPVAAAVDDLRGLAADADGPVYWAGTGPGTRFELTETERGKVFVRYLPEGVPVADRRPDFLTVGTYPYPGAYEATDESSRDDGMVRALAPGGGLAVWSEERPSSVYLAHPGADVLVEVFSPDGDEAQELVLDGDVAPVGAGAPGSGSERPNLAQPGDLQP